MFGIEKTSIFLCLFILFVNQCLFIHSFRLMHDDIDQNEGDDKRRAVIRRLAFESFAIPEDLSLTDKDLQVPVERTVQRRFCCMSPLSGRKRLVRDLARKQIEQQQA